MSTIKELVDSAGTRAAQVAGQLSLARQRGAASVTMLTESMEKLTAAADDLRRATELMVEKGRLAGGKKDVDSGRTRVPSGEGAGGMVSVSDRETSGEDTKRRNRSSTPDRNKPGQQRGRRF